MNKARIVRDEPVRANQLSRANCDAGLLLPRGVTEETVIIIDDI